MKLTSANSSLTGNKTYADAFIGSVSMFRGGKQDSQGYARVFTILLFTLFIVLLLMAFVMGTNVYRSLSIMNTTTNDQRAALTMLANSVRNNDALSGVGINERGPEGNALVLSEHLPNGTFETRIYLYEGNVIQEYALAGANYMPSRATVIGPSETLEFAYDDGLLSITTDQGTSFVTLRTLRKGV